MNTADPAGPATAAPEGAHALQGAPALTGIRVVELANFIAGPFIGMLLADHGAEVIKVEAPGSGDGIRSWGGRKNGVGLYHKALNRNKSSVTADLGTALGREAVRRLAANADVVIESFRPGTLERWGLGYDVLAALNPGLVLVRVSGFGQTGPYRLRSGFGSLAEAMTGFAYTNGFPDRPPLLPGFALADTTSGLAGAFLTMAALEARRANGGRGQVVDLPIYDALLTMLGPHVIEFDQLGTVQERSGSRLPLVSPRNTFRTRDGKWIAVSAGAHAVFRRLCAALDVPELADDPLFADNQARRQNADAIEQALQAAVGRFDQEDLVRRFAEHDAPAAPVYSVADLLADPHVAARENIVTVQDEELAGPVRMQNAIGKLSANPARVERAGPGLGAQNRDILIGQLGFTADELAEAGISI
ncbi:CoA transferase [Enterovirga sp.]|uniref:CaiB/BaiF CoA transferase family protein n=1 Tax=Enterovirga sp. TaxID=2026350 RepID=UPI0026052F56|nr:CoA transferase [Enterovirga sp.]